MPEQRELLLTFHELAPEAPLIPVRMVNEFVYCPRLAYLEWAQGEFAHNADTIDGAIKHKRVDHKGGSFPEAPAKDEVIHARSISLSSTRLGITAKLDLVEGEGNIVTPVDYKRGSRPHVAAGAMIQSAFKFARKVFCFASMASTATSASSTLPDRGSASVYRSTMLWSKKRCRRSMRCAG